ncbi:hypothetical protein LCGC14_2950410, partial [marine sediment metagenome]
LTSVFVSYTIYTEDDEMNTMTNDTSKSARVALKAENRMLKTLVQEGRATVAQEARLTQVRNELMASPEMAR